MGCLAIPNPTTKLWVLTTLAVCPIVRPMSSTAPATTDEFDIRDIPVVASELAPICDNWGPRVDGTKVLIWDTQRQAKARAKAIGWPSDAAVKVHTRFTMGWALVHPTKDGHISVDTYRALHERRNGACPHLGHIIDALR